LAVLAPLRLDGRDVGSILIHREGAGGIFCPWRDRLSTASAEVLMLTLRGAGTSVMDASAATMAAPVTERGLPRLDAIEIAVEVDPQPRDDLGDLHHWVETAR
jgi:hypothetical protein